MSRITHFEIPSENPEVSMKFYADTFGWVFQQFGEQQYWMVTTGSDDQAGINGAIMKQNHPDQPVTNSIHVQNIDDSVKMIETNGGTIVVPKMAIPTVGWVAYFKDPDQNIFGVWQPDPKAA